jgi:hypothetical protein
MAYITTEEVKEKRDLIKKAFPAKEGWKFSVTREHHSSIVISLMQYPDSYNFGQSYQQINHYHLDNCGLGDDEKEVLKKVNEIAHIGWWDKSDIMTDYFNTAFYVNLQIAKWDRPATVVPAKVKKPSAEDKLNQFYFNLVKDGNDVADVLQLMYS